MVTMRTIETSGGSDHDRYTNTYPSVPVNSGIGCGNATLLAGTPAGVLTAGTIAEHQQGGRTETSCLSSNSKEEHHRSTIGFHENNKFVASPVVCGTATPRSQNDDHLEDDNNMRKNSRKRKELSRDYGIETSKNSRRKTQSLSMPLISLDEEDNYAAATRETPTNRRENATIVVTNQDNTTTTAPRTAMTSSYCHSPITQRHERKAAGILTQLQQEGKAVAAHQEASLPTARYSTYSSPVIQYSPLDKRERNHSQEQHQQDKRNYRDSENNHEQQQQIAAEAEDKKKSKKSAAGGIPNVDPLMKKQEFLENMLRNRRINVNDVVLCNRAPMLNKLAGNVQYQKMLESYVCVYATANRIDKPKIAIHIYRQITKMDPPGRFLKLEGGLPKSDDQPLTEIPAKKVLCKIRKSLKDGAAKVIASRVAESLSGTNAMNIQQDEIQGILATRKKQRKVNAPSRLEIQNSSNMLQHSVSPVVVKSKRKEAQKKKKEKKSTATSKKKKKQPEQKETTIVTKRVSKTKSPKITPANGEKIQELRCVSNDTTTAKDNANSFHSSLAPSELVTGSAPSCSSSIVSQQNVYSPPSVEICDSREEQQGLNAPVNHHNDQETAHFKNISSLTRSQNETTASKSSSPENKCTVKTTYCGKCLGTGILPVPLALRHLSSDTRDFDSPSSIKNIISKVSGGVDGVLEKNALINKSTANGEQQGLEQTSSNVLKHEDNLPQDNLVEGEQAIPQNQDGNSQPLPPNTSSRLSLQQHLQEECRSIHRKKQTETPFGAREIRKAEHLWDIKPKEDQTYPERINAIEAKATQMQAAFEAQNNNIVNVAVINNINAMLIKKIEDTERKWGVVISHKESMTLDDRILHLKEAALGLNNRLNSFIA